MLRTSARRAPIVPAGGTRGDRARVSVGSWRWRRERLSHPPRRGPPARSPQVRRACPLDGRGNHRAWSTTSADGSAGPTTIRPPVPRQTCVETVPDRMQAALLRAHDCRLFQPCPASRALSHPRCDGLTLDPAELRAQLSFRAGRILAHGPLESSAAPVLFAVCQPSARPAARQRANKHGGAAAAAWFRSRADNPRGAKRLRRVEPKTPRVRARPLANYRVI